jgi:threonine dehydratase
VSAPIVTVDDARAARERIAPHVRLTPVVRWRDDVWLKLELLQHGGSFKARGAFNRVLTAPAEQLARGVVTASGGNHGLGVGFVAAQRQVAATIYLPEKAPRSTAERLERMGARVIRHGRDWDDAWALAQGHARETGALLVHPFEDPEVIAGQGTIGLELAEQLGRLDVVVIAVGGGGLIGGVATVLKALQPSLRVIGVEPTGATAMKESLEAGRLVTLERVQTIAGTLAPRAIGPHTLELGARHIDEMVLVSDDEMRAGMKLLWNELRLLVEPAGAAALAAVQHGRVGVAGKRVAVLVCGANLDPPMAAEAMA